MCARMCDLRYFTVCHADEKNHMTCSGHGTCIFNELANPKRCMCDYGWVGDVCRTRPDDVALYAKQNTKTKVVLATTDPNNPEDWSNFYVGLVPSATINPDSMAGWTTTAIYDHFYDTVSMKLNSRRFHIMFDLAIKYGGKEPGVPTSFMQITLANVVTRYDNGKDRWNALATLEVKPDSYHKIDGDRVAAILQLKISSRYNTCSRFTSLFCPDWSEYSNRFFSLEVKSDGTFTDLSNQV